ncbi:MAG: hypothetical protein C4320_08065 [Armatimonadota bacterium]
MKLNLLPVHETTKNRSRDAFIGAVLIVLLCALAAAMMTIVSSQRLEASKKAEEDARPGAEAAVAVAKTADAAAAKPEVQALVTNVALSKAMLKHNDVYPDLYNSIRPYIPAFFRLTSLSATPLTGGAPGAAPGTAPPPPGIPGAPPAAADTGATSAINMQGVLRTYQEYADLMLALLRIPGAQSVGRAGFAGVELTVPNVVEIDQNGRPRKPQDPPIPDDPLARLTYFEDLPKESGYLNSGNFGSGQEGLRTVTPNASLVNVQVIVNRDLRTPVPRTSLAALGSPAAAPGGFPTGIPAAASAAAPPPSAAASGRPGGRRGGAGTAGADD